MSPRTLFAWVWALVVCFLLTHCTYLWLGKRVAPDTDILALLPVQERDPVLQKAFTRMVDSAQQRLIVLVGTGDWTQAVRAADAYLGVLAPHTDPGPCPSRPRHSFRLDHDGAERVSRCCKPRSRLGQAARHASDRRRQPFRVNCA